MEKMTLRNIINNINKYNDAINIMLPRKDMSLDSICMMIDNDDIEDEINVAIGLYVLKDILDNLRQQRINFNDDQALEAIQFYLQNDAFIELKK